MLIDSHCHLNFEKLQEDAAGIMERAQQANIGVMVNVCTKIHEFAPLLELSEKYDNVFCSVGTHPYYSHEEEEFSLEDIVKIAQHPKVVAIGEAGLDYFRNHSPVEAQQRSFRKHIAAARETGLPLIIHTRDAEEDTAAILEDEMEKGAFPALLHCFTASNWLAQKVLPLGLYISMSGVLTFNKSDELRQTVTQVPLDRLLVETDAPYLAPTPKRGKTNEPSFVVHTAQKLADVKKITFGEVETATTDNFFRLFSKVPKAQFENAAG